MLRFARKDGDLFEHCDLLHTYQQDFAKYAGRLTIQHLEDVLQAVPRLLCQKFMYSQVNPHANHASIKQAVNLLNKACLCHRVQCATANGIPLRAALNAKVFKLILIDVGLVSSLLGLRLYQFKTIDEIMLINKGAIAEQAVGQLLRTLQPFYQEPSLYYWTKVNTTASAEIDYLLQDNQFLIPVEVKAGSEGKLRSLHQFMHEKSWPLAIRIYAGTPQLQTVNVKTTSGYAVNYQLLSLPFYLITQIPRLLAGLLK